MIDLVLSITRKTALDPRALYFNHTTLWCGSVTGDGKTGDYLADKDFLSVDVIFFSSLTSDNFVRTGAACEMSIGEKYLALRSRNLVLADPQVGFDLLRQEGQAILQYLESQGVCSIEFMGGILQNVEGKPCILVLRCEDKGWKAFVRPMSEKSSFADYSLVFTREDLAHQAS